MSDRDRSGATDATIGDGLVGREAPHDGQHGRLPHEDGLVRTLAIFLGRLPLDTLHTSLSLLYIQSLTLRSKMANALSQHGQDGQANVIVTAQGDQHGQ